MASTADQTTASQIAADQTTASQIAADQTTVSQIAADPSTASQISADTSIVLLTAHQTSAAAAQTTVMPTASGPSASVEVVWRWTREDYQRRCDAGVNTYVDTSIIDDIETELQSSELGDTYKRFLEGCFGSYLRIQRRGYKYAAVLHCILAREIHRGDASEFELWFRLGEQFLRFSRHEYALVTGLRFVGSTFDTRRTYELPVGSLYDRVCGLCDQERIAVAELRSLFVEGVFRDSPDHSLMVAKVLFVQYMLVCRDPRSTRVDRWIWALVEDTDEWESFPWGKYSFQILMHYIQSLQPSLPAPGGPPRYRPPRYHFYGPSYALLIWALEAIPALGDLCGTMIDDRVPRCIRWRLDKTLVDLTDFFSQRTHICSMTLEASVEEWGQFYLDRIDGDLSGAPQYVHLETRCRTIYKGLPSKGGGCGRGQSGSARPVATRRATQSTRPASHLDTRPPKRSRIVSKDDETFGVFDGDQPLSSRSPHTSPRQPLRPSVSDVPPVLDPRLITIIRTVVRDEVERQMQSLRDQMGRLESHHERQLQAIRDEVAGFMELLERRQSREIQGIQERMER